MRQNTLLFSFSKNTTYGCGGVAKEAYFPDTRKRAEEIFDKVVKSRKNFFILGNGSDVLAQDGVYDGAVIVTKKLCGITKAQNGNIICDSGVSTFALLKYCEINGLGGLEFLSGIPATLGGVVYMNAGAAGQYIESRVKSVTIYDGTLRVLNNKNCNFTYKHSTMRDINAIILGCELAVTPSEPKKVKDACNYYLQLRQGLPKGKSCGCVFKNPDGFVAAELIEKAGLKGKRSGLAEVSRMHANFIINYGNLSQDVYKLILYVKNSVYQKFGILLEEEVCYIGDFK